MSEFRFLPPGGLFRVGIGTLRWPRAAVFRKLERPVQVETERDNQTHQFQCHAELVSADGFTMLSAPPNDEEWADRLIPVAGSEPVQPLVRVEGKFVAPEAPVAIAC